MDENLDLTEFPELFPPKLANYFARMQLRVQCLEMEAQQMKMVIDELINKQKDMQKEIDKLKHI